MHKLSVIPGGKVFITQWGGEVCMTGKCFRTQRALIYSEQEVPLFFHSFFVFSLFFHLLSLCSKCLHVVSAIFKISHTLFSGLGTNKIQFNGL